MDIETCIKKLSYVGVLDFATVDESGAPQVRNISAIHYEGTSLYFLTARGKYFASQLKKRRKSSGPRIHEVQGDDPTFRQAIVHGDSMPEPGLPESFNVLMHELKGLGLDIRLED